jgi:GT2 family glycosyltransferase
MLACMKQYPGAGVVGPRLLNGDGSVQRSCFKFPSPLRAWLENFWISAILPNTWAWGDWRRWAHDQERKVDFVSGAAMLVRREVFEETGGFDEEFFMYSEETDWQKRITANGWTVRFTPAAVVTHLGGASGAGESGKINRHFFESLDYYEMKHHGMAGLVLFRLAMVIGCAMRSLGWAVAWLVPSRRKVAAAKLKLRVWLIGRQATDWNIRFPTAGRKA